MACLDDKHCSRVKFFTLFAKVHVVHAKSAGDFVRIFGLMGTHQEYSGVYRQGIKLVAIESLVEPDKLGHESHVWISNLSPFSYELEAIFKSVLHGVYHVTKAHCGRPGNSLDTVNINSSILFLCLLHKFDNFVETALNVFSHMVFQVEWKVFDPILLVIVRTIIGCTVDNVSDT